MFLAFLLCQGRHKRIQNQPMVWGLPQKNSKRILKRQPPRLLLPRFVLNLFHRAQTVNLRLREGHISGLFQRAHLFQARNAHNGQRGKHLAGEIRQLQSADAVPRLLGKREELFIDRAVFRRIIALAPFRKAFPPAVS